MAAAQGCYAGQITQLHRQAFSVAARDRSCPGTQTVADRHGRARARARLPLLDLPRVHVRSRHFALAQLLRHPRVDGDAKEVDRPVQVRGGGDSALNLRWGIKGTGLRRIYGNELFYKVVAG